MKNTEVDIGHSRLAIAPICAVLQTEIATTGDQRRQVSRVVGRTGTASKENDGIVQHAAVAGFLRHHQVAERVQHADEEQDRHGEP